MIQQSTHAVSQRSLILVAAVVAAITLGFVVGQVATNMGSFGGGATTTTELRQAPALTLADDYFTRHSGIRSAPALSFGDDFGTRHFVIPTAPVLGPMDDYGTRHLVIPTAPVLGPTDDYGTRHAPAVIDPAAVWSERLTKLAEHYGINQGAAESKNSGGLDTKDDYGTRHTIR